MASTETARSDLTEVLVHHNDKQSNAIITRQASCYINSSNVATSNIISVTYIHTFSYRHTHHLTSSQSNQLIWLVERFVVNA